MSSWINFHDPFGTQRKFPVSGHDFDAEQLAGRDHVGSSCPQRSRRTLPTVAAIDEYGSGALRLYQFHERGKMSKAAHLSVTPRQHFEVDLGKCVREAGAAPQTVVP